VIVQPFLLLKTLRYIVLKTYTMHSFIKLSIVCQFDLLSDFHLTLPQEVVISVLMKLAGGCPSLADQLNVDAFLEQARSYDKASSSPVGWYIR
jgi:hypothetical protein